MEASADSVADALFQEVAGEMGAQLELLTSRVQERLTGEIEQLRGDAGLVEVLGESIHSNLEAFVRVARHGLATSDSSSPPAAAAYARRLAQRGTEPSALLRAYRLGQESALLWALDRVAQLATDGDVALRTTRRFVQEAFSYVDVISASVLAEYEDERVRWLANTNSLRTATIDELLAGHARDVATAERTLGHRLRQHHVGAVLWLDHRGSSGDLRALEDLAARVARESGASGALLFVPQDRYTAWCWLPFGRERREPGVLSEDLLEHLESLGANIALGSPSAGMEGFRSTHQEARSAQEIALVPRLRPRRFTSWAQPDVRAAALLLRDLEATRRLVATSLGGLADDTETNAGLRHTVRCFLAQQSSFPATAALLNVHKNTVRYRIDKAVEARGRPLNDDRLDLELALVACEWLGPTVLP